MNVMRPLKIALALALALLLAPPRELRAAGDELNLDLEASEVGLEDTLVATVSASGEAAGAGEPHLEIGTSFRIVGTSRSQSISFVNGRTSVELRWQYTLQPQREGSFELGPALVRVGGREIRSGKARVRVVAGSVAPPVQEPVDPWARIFGGPPAGRRRQVQQGKVRLIAELDRSEAYVGEQVTYTLRILTQLEVRTVKPRSDAQLTGFWTEALEVPNPPQPQRIEHEGEAYTSYLLRKTALFATAPGSLEIPPATWDLAVMVPNGFFGEVQEVARATEALRLEVKPHPEEGKPAGFAGAVGDLEIKAQLDKSEVKVGEAVALKITLSGTGNLKTLPAPELPDLADARSYASTNSQSIQMRGGRMSGSRTWEFVIVPNAPGDRVIPAIRYPYFSPAKRGYRIAESAPFPLQVSKGDAPDASIAGSAQQAGPAPAGTRKAVEPVHRDVAYLKLEAPGLGTPRRPFYQRHLVQAALALPILLNLGVGLYQWGRRRELSDPAAARRRLARRAAERKLKEATGRVETQRADELAAKVSEILVGFVADWVDEPAAGLTRDRLAELVGSGAGPERARDLLQLLDRCDYCAFTPAGGSPAESRKLIEQASSLLAVLERGLARGPKARRDARGARA